jgi:hypothetical protein
MSQINYYYTDEAYPDSKAIESVHFDSNHDDALVSFRHGGQYIVEDVTEDDFYNLVDADSVGRFYRDNWRGVKPHERVQVMNFVDHADVDKGSNWNVNDTIVPERNTDETPEYFRVAGLLGADVPAADADDATDVANESDATFSLRKLVDDLGSPVVSDEVESEEANAAVSVGRPGFPYKVTLVLWADSAKAALEAVEDSYVVEDNDGEVLSVERAN